jgi:hypothetical protein
MKVMLDKNWAAAVSSYSGRVKNHTRLLSIERELEKGNSTTTFFILRGGGE